MHIDIMHVFAVIMGITAIVFIYLALEGEDGVEYEPDGSTNRETCRSCSLS